MDAGASNSALLQEGEAIYEAARDHAPAADSSGTSQEMEGFAFDEASGLFYNSSLGYYFDPDSQLYGDASSGHWWKYHNGHYQLVS